MISFKVHRDSWSGEEITIKVPSNVGVRHIVDGHIIIEYSSVVSTTGGVTIVKNNYFPAFDDNFTFFARNNNIKDKLVNQGFTDVISLEGATTAETAKKFYFNSTDYFYLYYDGVYLMLSLEIPSAGRPYGGYAFRNSDATTFIGWNVIDRRYGNPIVFLSSVGDNSQVVSMKPNADDPNQGNYQVYYELFNRIAQKDITHTDPAERGGISVPSSSSEDDPRPEPDFFIESDDVALPTTPSISAITGKLVTCYVPTLAELNNLAGYLWSDSFLNAFKKLFDDPINAIIGLSILPVNPPVGTAETVSVGLIPLTGVTMRPATQQILTVSMGTLELTEYYLSALDYAPYTKVSIYLPYIGIRELYTDDVMNKSLTLVYNIDILSGSCVAMLKVNNSVLYQWTGNVASAVPINGRDFTSLVTSSIRLAATVGVTAVTAGAAGAAAAGNTANLFSHAAPSVAAKAETTAFTNAASKVISGNADSLKTASANEVSNIKPIIQRAGGISGSAGMLGVQQPYLIIERPVQSLAKDYNKFVGYPSNITVDTLGSLSGFTTIESIRLNAISCTENERSEIVSLLMGGVIL